MKEQELNGHLELGPNAETVVMTGYGILLRLVDVPMKESRIKLLNKNSAINPLEHFNGFTPYMVEVVAASKKAVEEGVNKGDICIPSKSFIAWMTDREGLPNNPITSQIHDGEVFLRATVGDIEAVLPYMRKYVIKGKIIVDKI